MEAGPSPIGFPEAEPTEATAGLTLDAEREAHQRRAARFGIDYVEPGKRKDLRLQFKKERLKRDGFKTGLDVFDQEEVAKMRQRAARFQTEFKSPEYAPAQPPEDEEKKRQRAARFGTEYTPADPGALMEIDVLEDRKERTWAIPRRPEAIHLYGVDCMSTGECLAYFGDWGPTFVEWIDDSSCNVLFEDDFTTKRALVGRGKPLPPDAAMPDTAGVDPSDINNAPFLWHKGDDFVKAGTPIPLMYRMATTADVKPEKGEKFSLYLWKLPAKQAVRRQQQEVRRRQNGAANGQDGGEEDAHMRQSRGPRSRKRRRGQGDVEMVDAEELDGEAEEEEGGDVPDAKRADVADLRQLLPKRSEPSTGLFSASAAGLLPPLREEPEGTGADVTEPEGEAAQPVVAQEPEELEAT